MKFTEVKPFIKYLKTRSYNLDIRYAKGKNDVLLTVYFIKDQRETLIISRQERECIAYIQQAIFYQQPDSVEVEINVDYISEFHQCIINDIVITDDKTDDKTDETFRRINESDDFVDSNNFPQQDNRQKIEEIINKRLEELKKEREIVEIKSKLAESNETIIQQKQTIESLKQTVEEKNRLIKTQKRKIDNKNKVEYYVQLAGEVIQTAGIKKEDIGKVLSGIFPLNMPTEHKDKIDESGIIEE